MMCNSTCNNCCDPNPCSCNKSTTTSTTTIYIEPCDGTICEEVILYDCLEKIPSQATGCLGITAQDSMITIFQKLLTKLKADGVKCNCEYCDAIVEKVQDFYFITNNVNYYE